MCAVASYSLGAQTEQKGKKEKGVKIGSTMLAATCFHHHDVFPHHESRISRVKDYELKTLQL
jgi:hypothetical protein